MTASLKRLKKLSFDYNFILFYNPSGLAVKKEKRKMTNENKSLSRDS